MFSKGLLPVLAMQFVLIACTVNSSPVDIGGIQYCVPRENFIDAPPWTPQEMPSDGFAFSWLASTGKKGFDTAAQFDVSGVVSDAKRFAWWSHPKQDHFYRRVAENSMAVREAQGNQLFVFENSDRKRAYIWKLARASGDGATPIADDDELLALCKAKVGRRLDQSLRMVREFVGERWSTKPLALSTG